MVTGSSKVWVGINDTATELCLSNTKPEEIVLYDETVSANLDFSHGNDAIYYQTIDLPDYSSITNNYYSRIYIEYNLTGDAYCTPKKYYSDTNPYMSAYVNWMPISGMGATRSTMIAFKEFTDTMNTKFFFSELSNKRMLLVRSNGMYGETTYYDVSSTDEFGINLANRMSIIITYYKTGNTTVYNNNNIQHRVRIVGVI